MEYIAFFAVIPHTDFSYVEQTLKEYEIGEYIIAAETAQSSHNEKGGEHFHFLVQMQSKDYHNFSKRVFKDKYKLRGKATSDLPRQYGKVKEIRDFDRMAAYTIKDGNIRTNMSEEALQKFQQITFKKDEKQKKKQIPWARRVAEEMEVKMKSTIVTYCTLVAYEFEEHPIGHMHKGQFLAADDYMLFVATKKKLLTFIVERMGQDVKTLSSSIVNNLFWGIMNYHIQKSDNKTAKAAYIDKLFNKLNI